MRRVSLSWTLGAVLLLLCYGCAEFYGPHTSRPERDVWQQPKTVIDALHIQPGSRVADLGAGWGYFTFRLAEAVGPEGRVYAVDVDQSNLAYLGHQVKNRGLTNIESVLAAGDDPRLPADGVDLIFACNVYHHLTDRVTYFQSLKRYLRPGGRVAIIDFSEEDLSSLFSDHTISKETVRSEMQDAGYDLMTDFGFLELQHFQLFKPG